MITASIKEDVMHKYLAVVATTIGMPQVTYEIHESNDERAREGARYLCEQYYGVRWFMSLSLYEIIHQHGETDIHRFIATYRVEPRVVEVQGRR
jgi:hypothetical protein